MEFSIINKNVVEEKWLFINSCKLIRYYAVKNKEACKKLIIYNVLSMNILQDSKSNH